MKKITAILIALICLIAFASCSSDTHSSENIADSEVTQGVDTVEAEAEKTVTISTPYCDLKAPEFYNGNVVWTVENENPYTLSFKSKDDSTDLFTLIFGGEGECVMGTLIREEGNITVYFNYPTLDTAAASYEKNSEYQEGFGIITANLANDYEFVTGEIIENEDNTTFDIPTSVVTLKYPARWQESVWVEVADNGVKFSCNSVPLFDIMFTECDGYLLGTYNGTPVYIVEYQVTEQTHIEMQADVNVIFQNLMQDSAFTVAE